MTTPSSLELLTQSFATALDIELESVNDKLAYQENPKWDSTAHMMLIAQLETDFDVMFEMDDILDMSSFSKAQSILIKCKPELTFD